MESTNYVDFRIANFYRGMTLNGRLLLLGMLNLTLTACGGGDGADTSYRFVTPAMGAQSVYAETLVDNLNNTFNTTLVTKVTEVHADGSFVTTTEDPSRNGMTSGTVNHTFYPTTLNVNQAGQTSDSVVALPNGTFYTCVFSPLNMGVALPIEIGQTWAVNVKRSCSNSATTTTTITTTSESDTLAGTESVTVVAGTFNAYKFQTTSTATNANGTTITESTTSWRNASKADSRTLKAISSYTYTGTAPPPGSTLSTTRVLQSYQ